MVTPQKWSRGGAQGPQPSTRSCPHGSRTQTPGLLRVCITHLSSFQSLPPNAVLSPLHLHLSQIQILHALLASSEFRKAPSLTDTSSRGARPSLFYSLTDAYFRSLAHPAAPEPLSSQTGRTAPARLFFCLLVTTSLTCVLGTEPFSLTRLSAPKGTLQHPGQGMVAPQGLVITAHSSI